MHRRAVFVASGLLVAALLAGDASASPVTVSDTVGDANAVNGQDLVTAPGENTATPGSQTGYDITSVTLASTFTGKGRKRAPRDLVVRLELAGKPLRSEVVYSVETGRIGDCQSGIMIQFWAGLDGGGWTSHLRTCPTGGLDLGYTIPLRMPTFGERTVTWTVPYDRLTSIPHVKLRLGDPLPDLGAVTRVDNGAYAIPVVDTLTSTASYRLGS